MNAYVGFANFTLNAEPPDKRHIINLKTLYSKIKLFSVQRKANKLVKSLTIEKVEICSASRGCTPKTRLNKHQNYLTAYKNAEYEIKTPKYNGEDKNFALLNIKGTVRIGDKTELLAIRIPKSGVLGVKVGLSIQQEIIVSRPDADHKIEYLGYELTKLIYDILPVPALRPTKLSGLTVHGWNISDPTGGQRPPQRVKNFVNMLQLLGRNIDTHELDYEPSEFKQVTRGNFKPVVPGDPTIGVTAWLMVDFSGVKSIARVRELSGSIYNAYNRVLPEITWNGNFKGPVPKSRRKTEAKKTPKKAINKNINIPKKNGNSKLLMYKGKKFNCSLTSKPELVSIAKKLGVNPDGFKEGICRRILEKLS